MILPLQNLSTFFYGFGGALLTAFAVYKVIIAAIDLMGDTLQ